MQRRRFSLSLFAGVLAGLPVLFGVGCGVNSRSPVEQAEVQAELTRLRAENQEVKRLRAENADLDRLRRERLEIERLRPQLQGIEQLRQENEQLKQALAQAPASRSNTPPAAVAPTPEIPQPPPHIVNFPEAFAEAASWASGLPVREEDVAKEGDLLEVDQSVIGILIPDFATNAPGGKYEVSGWLRSKGVTLTNYQQLNYLGITNFTVRRAPPDAKTNP